MEPEDRKSETLLTRFRSFKRSWDFSPEKISAMIAYIPIVVLRILLYLIRSLYKGFLWLASNRLQHLIIFICSVIFLICIFSNTPLWFRNVVAGVGVMLLSSIGLSFLDHRYGVFEKSIEDKMLYHARRQFALGIDDSEDQLDNSLANQPFGSTLSPPEKMEVLFRQYGIDVKHVDSEQTQIEYLEVFYTESQKPLIPPDLPKNMKEHVGLKNVPVIHVDKNLIYVHIYKTG